MSQGDPCVYFATPATDHMVTLNYLTAWTNTVWALKDRGISHGCINRGGDCFVAKVRSKIVGDFLQTDGTDLFFLDSDIGWPAEKVIEFIHRPEPIIAGVYPKKSDELDWPVQLDADASTGALVELAGLVRANGFAAAGFMRIKRRVLQHLWDKAPPFKDVEPHGKIGQYRAVFNSGPDADGWWCGEDVNFCREAVAAGFDIWVDPDIEFTHRGGKTWAGRLSDHLGTFRDKAAQLKQKDAA
jgi:hypothetical protein